MSDFDYIRVERTPDEGTAWIVLDDPDRRNALNARMVAELKEALRALEGEEAVRAVGLRGAGPDFCAGADLKEVRATMDEGALASLEDADGLGELFVLLRRLSRPVVAAVHGRALAGGCGLATACDLIVAAEDAEFGYPEVRLGFVPAMVMALLRRSLGEKRAFELAALGDRFGAARAHELGLVARLFPPEGFEDAARAYAAELASRSGSAVRLTKRLLYGLDGVGFEDAIRTGAEVNALARLTDDCRAGVDRFLSR